MAFLCQSKIEMGYHHNYGRSKLVLIITFHFACLLRSLQVKFIWVQLGHSIFFLFHFSSLFTTNARKCSPSSGWVSGHWVDSKYAMPIGRACAQPPNACRVLKGATRQPRSTAICLANAWRSLAGISGLGFAPISQRIKKRTKRTRLGFVPWLLT